jgi:hypothetical protein
MKKRTKGLATNPRQLLFIGCIGIAGLLSWSPYHMSLSTCSCRDADHSHEPPVNNDKTENALLPIVPTHQTYHASTVSTTPALHNDFRRFVLPPVDDYLVQQGDSLWKRGEWDGAPIVIEQYKLVFFTVPKVGCTVWKQLFRWMHGYPDWHKTNIHAMVPWNPDTNGLTYLYDFNRSQASHIMTSPEWTRAIFVRDPKERFLSAYLDKAIANPDFVRRKCCYWARDCVESLRQDNHSLLPFLALVQTCDDGHWRPQHRRMEAKYWPYINFVGHMETVTADARRLLQQIGAWEDYGRTGWGLHGNSSIFASTSSSNNSSAITKEEGRRHATHAQQRLRQYYQTVELEELVDRYYVSDYANPILGLSKKKIAIP